MDKETQMIVDKLGFFRDAIVHHDEYKTQDLIHWLAVAGDMIEELASVKEQLSGMEIMLTCAQSAAETWERKCREQCSWISVKERLPDKMAIVLFATRNNPAVYRGRYLDTGDKQAHYFTTRIGRANSGGTYAATHWMPLPEPPKE